MSIRTVLVCGGAGYVGAHAAALLRDKGLDVVVLDNLSTGHRDVAEQFDFVESDIRDGAALDRAFSRRSYDAVVHFAASSIVPESVRDPFLYYENNVAGTLSLLQAMRRSAVQKIVFSSTAAVYGTPSYTPINEIHPKVPINPYGRSKLMVEMLLEDAAAAYGIASVSLRYFNAAGAGPRGEFGERHEPETHLIPNVLMAARAGDKVALFGSDYDTADGTCVRDFVHVSDLAAAHWQALELLDRATEPEAHRFNLGTGDGSSVLEIVRAAERLFGAPIGIDARPRRAGDPAVLVADSALAREVLGWEARNSSPDEIIRSAWLHHQASANLPS